MSHDGRFVLVAGDFWLRVRRDMRHQLHGRRSKKWRAIASCTAGRSQRASQQVLTQSDVQCAWVTCGTMHQPHSNKMGRCRRNVVACEKTNSLKCVALCMLSPSVDPKAPFLGWSIILVEEEIRCILLKGSREPTAKDIGKTHVSPKMLPPTRIDMSLHGKFRSERCLSTPMGPRDLAVHWHSRMLGFTL